MRGQDNSTDAMFVYLSPESFVPKDHSLRPIRKMVDAALAELDPEVQAMYSHTGRPSIAPQKESQRAKSAWKLKKKPTKGEKLVRYVRFSTPC